MVGFNSLIITWIWICISAGNAAQAATSFDLYKHLGNLSPYFEPDNTPASLLSGTPDTCTVDRAFLIHRHGSRQPISGEIEVIQALSYYINNNTALFSNPHGTPPSEFAFLAKGWTSTFRTNDLTAPGRQQCYDHGVALRLAYPSLYTDTLLVGGQDRVVESAQWFAAGYYGRYANTTATLDVIGENNATISWITSTDTCDDWEYSSGNDLVNQWDADYLPAIATRINKRLAPTYPGVNFTSANAHGMLYACAYGTAVYGKGNAPWCGVFKEQEILSFEYELDLLMRGAFGYGLPREQGPVLGSLLVSNVTAFMQANGSAAQNLSLNFAHDSTIDLGLTALGLVNDTQYPVDGPPSSYRLWRTSYQVPFAAQMFWKRLDCSGEKRLQLVLNGANFDLGPVGCDSDIYGTCSMSAFLATPNVKDALNITDGDSIWTAACSS
ncbi:histidine phosphatase superfamily [Delphinella strobiligena]|nr:histidine phosphatase superfamily [Delphinella strobiligena]